VLTGISPREWLAHDDDRVFETALVVARELAAERAETGD